MSKNTIIRINCPVKPTPRQMKEISHNMEYHFPKCIKRMLYEEDEYDHELVIELFSATVVLKGFKEAYAMTHIHDVASSIGSHAVILLREIEERGYCDYIRIESEEIA